MEPKKLVRGGLATGKKQQSLRKGKEVAEEVFLIDEWKGRGESKKDLAVRA